MTLKNSKSLILSLLLDDLIHAKLLHGLTALNLKPDDYCIDLGDKVIKLMGFRGRQNELVYEYYQERRKLSATIDLTDGNRQMQKLAGSIYNELLQLQARNR